MTEHQHDVASSDPVSDRAIDTHSHYAPAAWIAMVVAEASHDEAFADLTKGVRRAFADEQHPIRRLDWRLAEMDVAGVAVSVLSLPSPGAGFNDQATTVAAAQAGNDGLLEAASQHPTRLDALATLPFPYVDDALAELRRVARHPRCRGVQVVTRHEPWSMDDPSFFDVYALAADLGLPIVTHPALECLPEAYADWNMAPVLAPIVNSSVGISRFLMSGMLDRLPTLDLVVPHLGGFVPFLAARFDDFGMGDASHPLAYYLTERMYFDSCSLHEPALRFAVETMGADRLVFGTDYPYRGTLQLAVQHVHSALNDEAVAATILGVTASQWFGPDAG
ncbi:MAG: amidohydrolase [Ilumatobacteraceae bacterium]|nr:amidohydrolase [Ilumatobacteraceae bacterium]